MHYAVANTNPFKKELCKSEFFRCGHCQTGYTINTKDLIIGEAYLSCRYCYKESTIIINKA